MNRKYESNWRQKTLENLEKKIWPPINPDKETRLVKTCNQLRKKQLQEFTIEDLRIMIGQEIGLYFLVPLAIEHLTDNLFAEGDLYEGDLLNSILNIDSKYWQENNDYWKSIFDLIDERRNELKECNIKVTKFENCKR